MSRAALVDAAVGCGRGGGVVVVEARDGWSFESAREPAWFTHAESFGVEHALRKDATLCGLPREQVTVYRSLFEAGGVRACPGCVERAAAAPTEPCEQERLHDLVLAAADGPLRDRLVAVLRQGAEITMWVNGGGESVGKHYARLDRVVEGAEALAAALRTPGRVGVARVVDDGGEFIVVLPGEGSPAIGWATAGGR